MFEAPNERLPRELMEYVQRWQSIEFEYRSQKFPLEFNAQLIRTEGMGEGTLWWNQIVGKLKRAQVLGLTTPVGRQAMAKCAAAALSLTETAVFEYGLLTKPGVTSGEQLSEPFDWIQ